MIYTINDYDPFFYNRTGTREIPQIQENMLKSIYYKNSPVF